MICSLIGYRVSKMDMTQVEIFLMVLYVLTAFGLYGVISLISWVEDNYNEL